MLFYWNLQNRKLQILITMWHKILLFGFFAILSCFSIFLCVCVIFFLSSFWISIFLWSCNEKVPPLPNFSHKKCSPLKLSLIMENKVLYFQLNTTFWKSPKEISSNKNYIKTSTFWPSQSIPITVHVLFSCRLSSHHAFDSLISWLYFKNMVKEK